MNFIDELKNAPLIGAVKKAVQKKAEVDRKRREEKERQFMAAFPHKYMLALKEKNIITPKESDLWEQITNESYVVTDADENVIYCKGRILARNLQL